MDKRSLHPSLGTREATRTETRLRLLVETGLLLASKNSLDVIVQATLEAGLRLSGAALGAFFHAGPFPHEATLSGNSPAPYTHCRHTGNIAGNPQFALPHPATLFSGTDSNPARPVRFADTANLTGDLQRVDRLGAKNPASSPALVRSLLAVPVQSRSGRLFGALVYGHPEPNTFDGESENLVVTLATQAALAWEHAQLHESIAQEMAATEAVRGEQRTTSRRLTEALEAAQLGTWNWNAQTGLVDFDERGAALFGVEPRVPLPRNELRERLVTTADLHRTPSDLRAILEGGNRYTAEYRIGTTMGGERWIAVSGSATHEGENGRVTGMVGTLQDITPRKAQEDSLRTSEKLAATGRLAATIAHEINNPLEAVTNLIYLAKTDPTTPATVSRMLETADTELARVAQIAQQTLGFYRDTTRPVSVDLNDLLKAVVDLFDRKLTSKRLQCTLDLEPGLTVVGLQGEIRQVVSNLLVNAIDACGTTGGRIRIRARHRHRNGRKGVSVLVSDGGTGIPVHLHARLFTPFTTTKQSLGTGLGLWVTQGMVEKHGGSVRFRSRTQVPSGTVFRVYLPEMGSPQLFAHQKSSVLQ